MIKKRLPYFGKFRLSEDEVIKMNFLPEVHLFYVPKLYYLDFHR